MSDTISPRLRAYMWLVWTGGAVALAQAFGAPHFFGPISPGSSLTFILMLVLALVTEMKPIPYSFGGEGKETSLTLAVILGMMLTSDWRLAVLVATASVVVADLVASKPYYKILFNASVYAISTAVAAVVLDGTRDLLTRLGVAPVPVLLGAGVAAGLIYYLVNVTLLMIAIAEVQGTSVREMIAWDIRDSVAVSLALVTIAIAMALLWRVHPLAAVMLLPQIYAAKVAYERYTRLRTEAESVLATLADLLDLRDHNTGHHSLRVSELTFAVAKHMGVSVDRALAVKAVARVHDIGKVIIRDAVLLKPGALTPEERFEIQTHVEAGAQILGHLTAYQPHLPILQQHHERVDGRGYPGGLSGAQIDLGARIVSVCDAFDTMTSDRPYRSAVSTEEAMRELRRHAGTQFDPATIDALEACLVQERRLRIPAARSSQPASVEVLDIARASQQRV